jgi:hypothetical protein
MEDRVNPTQTHRTGPIRALLVAPSGGTWMREIRLPFPPFPGLGIRLDTYDVVTVDSVVVDDDPRFEVDVTCFVSVEARPDVTDADWGRLGFERGVYL